MFQESSLTHRDSALPDIEIIFFTLDKEKKIGISFLNAPRKFYLRLVKRMSKDSVHDLYQKFISKRIRFKDMDRADYHRMLRTFQKHNLYEPTPSANAFLRSDLEPEELKKRTGPLRVKWC